MGSREIEVENKKFVIEVKANDQGRFVKILEVDMSVGPSMCLSVLHALLYTPSGPHVLHMYMCVVQQYRLA